jgi:hypothetical protein
MMRTLSPMADPTTTPPDAETQLPGEALDSGFEFRSAQTMPEARLSPEARRRVIEKMESVDEARLRAARDGHTAYVG